MSLELVFKTSRALEKYRSGPLQDHLDGFCGWLLKQGFKYGTIRQHLANLYHFNESLAQQNHRKLRRLSAKQVDAFLKAYPSRAKNRCPIEQHVRRIRWSINRFVQYLQQLGYFDQPAKPEIYQSVLTDYLQWMRNCRDAVTGTLDVRRHSLSQFLKWLGPKATYQGLAELTPEAIEQFFLSDAQTLGPSARRSMQAAVRTFLRFCLQKAVIQHPLDKAVPIRRTYRLATVPRGLSDEQAQTLLDCVNRKTPMGRRDYAIIQLLYTYGVRGGHVRALQLTDIQWSKNQILFKALKHGKDILLPLTQDVGKSLLDYLQNGRPAYACSDVFLTTKAPYHRLAHTTLSGIVRRYILKVKIEVPCKGSHALRHCFATRMVQAGHPLKSVADVLGHRCLSTTFIYTKIDFNALRQAALQWPQEVSR